jgi:hypothetical protein
VFRVDNISRDPVTDRAAAYEPLRQCERARGVARRLREAQERIDAVLEDSRKRASCVNCGAETELQYADGSGGAVSFCADCVSRALEHAARR